jgi:hypothetical protein
MMMAHSALQVVPTNSAVMPADHFRSPGIAGPNTASSAVKATRMPPEGTEESAVMTCSPAWRSPG